MNNCFYTTQGEIKCNTIEKFSRASDDAIMKQIIQERQKNLNQQKDNQIQKCGPGKNKCPKRICCINGMCNNNGTVFGKECSIKLPGRNSSYYRIGDYNGVYDGR